MTSPWDEVRQESIEVPLEPTSSHRVPTPLPWMLLVVSLSMTAGVLVLGRVRLEEERTRTANALRANDELKSRVKQLEANAEVVAPPPSHEDEELVAGLKAQLVSMELEKRRAVEQLKECTSRRRK